MPTSPLCSQADCVRPPHARGLCSTHYARLLRHGSADAHGARIVGTVAERFWPKVNKAGPVPEHRPDLGQCWLWTAATFSDGYGQIRVDGKTEYAHRVAFVLAGGVLVPALTLDHLCRLRACVRPTHLEQVTLAENLRRAPSQVTTANAAKTHCPRNHPYDEANTYRHPRGHRVCRACRRAGGGAVMLS